MTAPVAFISSHAELGGSERVMLDLIRSITRPVADIITLRSGPLEEQLEALGRDVTVLETGAGPVAIFRAAVALRRVLRRSKAAVIHANGVKAALVTALARPRQRIIWWKHDHSWDGWLGSFIARRCDVVVGVSRSVLLSLPVSADLRVVHPGIETPGPDIEELSGAVRTELGGPGRRIVGLVGRLHPTKGHGELLAIADRLGAAGIDLVFVGPDDPDQSSYRDEIVTRVEAAANVRLVGHREDALAVIAACDAIAIPSVQDERGMGLEGFGLVAVEAMSLGVPVVAYADGALPEVLGDCGYLVAPGDRDALAAALERAVSDPSAGACGPERARTRFSLPRMVEEAEEIYDEVARRSR